jgi:hypothetical protein
VSYTHDDFLDVGVWIGWDGRSHFETFWKRPVGTGERVISGDGDVLGNSSIHALAIVLERRCLSVQDLACHINGATEAVVHALCSHAHTKDGDLATKVLDSIVAYTGILRWVTWSWADD